MILFVIEKLFHLLCKKKKKNLNKKQTPYTTKQTKTQKQECTIFIV